MTRFGHNAVSRVHQISATRGEMSIMVHNSAVVTVCNLFYEVLVSVLKQFVAKQDI